MNAEPRTAHTIKAASALLTLLVLLGGIPAGLARTVGWPLPRSVPNIGDITSALGGQSIGDSFLVKVLAVLCWLAWAQFVACVAAEVIGWRRGRGSRPVPLSGALQPLVAQLVMTAALLLQLGPRPTVASPVVLRTAATAAIRDTAPPCSVKPAVAAIPLVDAGPARTQGEQSPLPTYTVKLRDDLWTLAEDHLGDAGRWRELFELNHGRPQPHGGVLRDSKLIRPGWILRFPNDAVGLNGAATVAATAGPVATSPATARAAGPAAAPAPSQTAAPRPSTAAPTAESSTAPTLPAIARDSLQAVTSPATELRAPSSVLETGPATEPSAPAPAQEAAPLTEPSAPAPAQEAAPLTEPSVPTPLQETGPMTESSAPAPAQKVAPVTEATAPASGQEVVSATAARSPDPVTARGSHEFSPGAETAATTSPNPPSTSTPAEEPGSRAAVPESEQGPAHPSSGSEAPHSSKSPVGLLGAGLLAAGCVATLERMRRAQQRRRPSRRAIRMPDPSAVSTEVTLRRAAVGSAAGYLDLALRLFARRAADRSGSAVPAVSAVSAVSAVQVGPDGRVELLFNAPLEGPAAPFSVDGDGLVWTLSAGVPEDTLVNSAGDIGAPLPALVSVGCLSGTTVLVDLEAAGCTALAGDDEGAVAALRAMALEVATSMWADTVEVVVVSAAAFPALERARVVFTIAEVLDDLAAGAGALNDALARVGAPTTLAARLGDHSADGWIPTVVFCEQPDAEPEAFADLVALAAGGGRGLAVVAVGDHAEAGRVVRFCDGKVEVSPPGVVLEPVGPTAPQLAAVEEILTAAADTNGVEPENDATDDGPEREPGPRLDVLYQEQIDVVVRLLGPVEIDGAKAPIDRRRAVELIVYLATHPEGVDDERLKTALWPDEVASQSSFNTTVTRARSRLGADPDGVPHLPHLVATGGVYRLGPAVTTDIALLEGHLTAARHSTPESVTHTLRSGLELVRGVPFAGVRHGYEWAYAEGLVARMEVIVADAAHHLARLALDARDADIAHWAAFQGLLACPGDEVLYRDRMLAFDLAGNPAGVEAVMDELVAVAEALEPYDTLHPETIALYNRLSHRRRRIG